MTTIQVEAHLSTEQLLHAIESLPADALQLVVRRLLELRAMRAAPHVSTDEAALLEIINQPLPSAIQHRYLMFVAKRRTETLTPAEHAELQALSDQLEQRDATRMAAFAALARARQMSVPELMDALGIQTPAYA